MKFNLDTSFAPAGDQPKAIKGLVSGIKKQSKDLTLLGVTGSGKTFTIANVIEKVQQPTLVIAHNKTLAAQLCQEFRGYFPRNAVEYFVSYYDYYQPEAYMPHSDTYIEKEAQINEEIDRLRHACTQAILTRNDVIIVASVSAIYNIGSPKEYENIVLHLEKGQPLDRRGMLERLIGMQFERTNGELKRGSFRMRGQIFDIMPTHEQMVYRFEISDTINRIEHIDPITRKVRTELADAWFFPAKHHVIGEQAKGAAMVHIREDLQERLNFFNKKGKLVECERLKRKVGYDLEMIDTVGYCSGIENYSRYFEDREPGKPPFTMLDYFHHATTKHNSTGFLTVIDESHVTLPQIRGMHNGDAARKKTLIEHGFRLPSALDNRPLRFDEFDARRDTVVYVSATPGSYELEHSDSVVEQIIRPTGLVDPDVVIAPVTEKKDKSGNIVHLSQVDDVVFRAKERIMSGERVLITTLTKKMAEDLTHYLEEKKFRVAYLHSDIKTIERIEIITALRKGEYDIIVGVNLLREGLDIPEVSLVAILDADKEGFLRSDTSLIQTIGRAARNSNGQVILYADQITGSIERAIEETTRRRDKQLAHNKKHGITPKTIQKEIRNMLEEFGISSTKEDRMQRGLGASKKHETLSLDLLGDARSLKEIIKEKETQMKEAANDLAFELAAILRDEIRELRVRERVEKSKNAKKRI
ncbi:MAG: excinuclease ABC subunit UvrB [Candidatus Magasanikbacteria bacterium]|jgi:excinuclease ABC subunit B|nr:excinuclease ABC subunit UvrB [Candidatus Magasanikbacteria bacterium]MBT5820503.1 excinuclease ABC subunit UvrB [Candidatus Magasanikbacteria bacterium]MBT6294178.1 excinuclease ABC subunit UvrB [Candidatus Magasanikbacteria bacterium]